MASDSAAVDAALQLMRRLPPEAVVANLGTLLGARPDLTEELLSRVDQPLQVATDEVSGRDFLLCDYNRDADSYRSPWSNEYFPALEDGARPPEALRVLEVQANELFGAYREAYYEGGTSSVYLWEPACGEGEAPPAPGAFAGCFLVHKGEGSDRHGGGLQRGYWDAIHVAEALPSAGGAEGAATYKLTSTVSLFLRTASAAAGDAAADGPHGVAGGGSVSLAGSLTRTATSSGVAKGNAGGAHLVNLGRLVEETENKLRSTIDAVYFGKTRSVVAQLRASDGEMALDRRASLQTSLVTDMLRRSGVQPGAGPGGPMGLGAGFDPKAALAGLRKKAPPPPDADA